MIKTFLMLIIIISILAFVPRRIELINETIPEHLEEIPGEITEIVEVGYRTITAYTLGNPSETDETPCLGAFNDNLCEIKRKGRQVCATNEFEKGTLLRLGDIVCEVLDRTNGRYRHRVDVAMDEYENAKAFGKKIIMVEVIRYGK